MFSIQMATSPTISPGSAIYRDEKYPEVGKFMIRKRI